MSLVLAKLISEAMLPPGVSQYSPSSTSTLIRTAFGSSGPPGSHASAKVFHSSFSFASSSTTAAVPVSATHEERDENVSDTRGSAWMSATCLVSRAAMNHISASGSTSWRAIGTLRTPAPPYVVSIAIGMSPISSTSLAWSPGSVMVVSSGSGWWIGWVGVGVTRRSGRR